MLPDSMEKSRATNAAMAAITMLEVTSSATVPTPAPVTSAPSLRPSMPRSTPPTIGTAKNRKMARSIQLKPSPPPLLRSGVAAAPAGLRR